MQGISCERVCHSIGISITDRQNPVIYSRTEDQVHKEHACCSWENRWKNWCRLYPTNTDSFMRKNQHCKVWVQGLEYNASGATGCSFLPLSLYLLILQLLSSFHKSSSCITRCHYSLQDSYARRVRELTLETRLDLRQARGEEAKHGYMRWARCSC